MLLQAEVCLEGPQPQQGSWRCPGAPRGGPTPQGSAEGSGQRAPWIILASRALCYSPRYILGGRRDAAAHGDVAPSTKCSSVARPHLSLCHQDLCSGSLGRCRERAACPWIAPFGCLCPAFLIFTVGEGWLSLWHPQAADIRRSSSGTALTCWDPTACSKPMDAQSVPDSLGNTRKKSTKG